MTVYLIRHGKTEANERRLYCGSTDLSLSEGGRAELEKLRYAEPARCRRISSGMRRCNETLQILFGPGEFEIVPALREMNFGAFEMQSYEQLKEKPAYGAWITGDNCANCPPGGESGNAMTARALAAFDEIWQAGQNAVIVTHGGVIAAIMARLFPAENKNRYQWQPQPGHGYAVTEAGYRPLP